MQGATTEIGVCAVRNSYDDAELIAARLKAHSDFRVLRRLDKSREWPGIVGRSFRLWATGRRSAATDTSITIGSASPRCNVRQVQ